MRPTLFATAVLLVSSGQGFGQPRPAFELTRDTPRCFVGYTCHDRFTEGGGRE